MTTIKRIALPLFVLLFACSLANAGGNLNFTISDRHLEDDSWAKVQNQVGFGAAVDFSPENWPLHWVFGLHGSLRRENNDEDFHWFDTPDYEGRIGELAFGVVFLPIRTGSTRPYIGGGIAKTFSRLELKIDGDNVSESDNSFGWYVNGGVYWRVGSRINIGIDGRILRGTSGNLFGVDRSMDYKQIGLLVGFGF